MINQHSLILKNMDVVILQASEIDTQVIVDIGRKAVKESHKNSCSEADMEHFLDAHYNERTIKNELNDPINVYHIISYKGQPAGFSKIILNAEHPNIRQKNVTKLERIYLYSSFYDLKLGYRLLHHNVSLSKEAGQCGMWLFTWINNERAVNFYKRNNFAIIGAHKFKISDAHYNSHHHMFLNYKEQASATGN